MFARERMLMFAKSQWHRLISARWLVVTVMGERGKEREREREIVVDENEFVVGRDATRCVALRRNNLFDDFSV